MPFKPTTSPKASDARPMLTEEAYEHLRLSLMSGVFKPGERLSVRRIAAEIGVSLTPMREAMQRLIANGVLDARANASPEVPLLDAVSFLELADLRAMIEGDLGARAAQLIRPRSLARLRALAQAIELARARKDQVADMAGIRSFHFELYSIANRPFSLEMVANLWLRTGPYLNVLYSGFLQTVINTDPKDRTRTKILAALAAGDPNATRRAVIDDIKPPLEWVAAQLKATGATSLSATTRD